MAATQATPPCWKDFGKSANDLLNKDFPLKGNELEVKTRAPNNITFRVTGSRDSKTSAILGDLETKYLDPKNGVTLTQTWTSGNVLKTQVELENQVAKGLKLDLQAHLHPTTAAQTGLIQAIYKQPSLHTRALLDVFKGPTFTADAVIGRDGFLLGLESTYSVPTGSITRTSVGLGYSAPSYTLTLHSLSNLSLYSASYYHRVSADTEVGGKAVWDVKRGGEVGIEVGGKVYLDGSAFVKAKINNSGILLLGYTQALRPGVKASFGLALDTLKLGDASVAVGGGEKAVGGAAHKVGMGLVFEA